MPHWRSFLVGRRREDPLIGVTSYAPSRDFHERGRLSKTLENDVPGNICVVGVEFVARHQPGEYVAQN